MKNLADRVFFVLMVGAIALLSGLVNLQKNMIREQAAEVERLTVAAESVPTPRVDYPTGNVCRPVVEVAGARFQFKAPPSVCRSL